MVETVETKLPCPECNSSDAYALYDDGHGYCFSCNVNIKDGEVYGTGDRDKSGGGDDSRADHSDSTNHKVPLIRDLDIIPLKKRGISQEICRKYGYGVDAQKRQVAPYCDSKGRVVAQKVRLPSKDFLVTGDLKKAGLFGQQLCRSGGKMIVITEGEIDAMSVTEVMGKSWPAVSVPNGGGKSAATAVARQIDFLETFEKVVLCFDSDEVGAEATDACVQLFSPGKVAIANLGGYKDPNDMLVNGDEAGLRDAIWGAQVYRPDGVVNMSSLYDRVRAPLEQGMTYPWEGLNEKLFGFRPGDLVTWTAGTGVGKSALVSELAYWCIAKGIHTGIVYLEEGVDRAGKRIVGLAMDKPLHLPDTEYTKAEFDRAWTETLGTERLFAYDHFGSLDEGTLLNRIRYMVKACGCRIIVLDHISMVVSGQDLDGDERRMLDHIMTNLKSLAQETGAAIHVVSHLRRPPGSGSHEEGRQVSLSHLRGTQAIAQLSDAVIAAERNQQAESEHERNTTQLRVLKNRYAGLTGPAGWVRYVHSTGRLVTCEDPNEEDISDGNNADY
jgi:twinkle protein